MKREKSCGGLVIRKSQETKILIIKSVCGHWSYPKGHVEDNESEVETSIREIKEETGLNCKIIPGFRHVITFKPHPDAIKDVVFFEAAPIDESEEVICQLSEVETYGWFSFAEALKLVTYQTDREVLLSYLAYHYYDFNKEVDRSLTGAVKWIKPRLPFWVADSDYATLPEITETLISRAKHGIFGYTDITKRAVESIALWYRQNHGIDLNSESICISNGVVSSIKRLLMLYNESNQVVVQTPGYHGFFKAVKAAKQSLIINQLNEDYSINLQHLEKCLQDGAKALIICSPHNPTGRVYSSSELKELFELGIKYQCLIIVDEIHSDIISQEHKFVSAISAIKETNTPNYSKLIVVNAPSKTFNIAGLYSSYIIFNNNVTAKNYHLDAEEQLFDEPSMLSLEALIAAYTHGYAWKEAQNYFIGKNYLYLTEALKNLSVKIAPLEATYLAWLDLSKVTTNEGLLKETLENCGIEVSYGSTFFSNKPGFIRFNLACPFQQLAKGVDGLKNGIKIILNKEKIC